MRAMLNKLPDLIDPVHSSQHHKHFVARVKQAAFPRLKQQLVQADKDVDVDVRFFRHPQHKMHAFEMRVETVMVLECQRSLQPFEFSVSSKIVGVFVESMSLAEDLPSDVEVYELSEDKISLMTLVEDELLLLVPLSPINEASEMHSLNASNSDAWPEAETLPETLHSQETPFAVLKGFKNKPN
ncbi:MAG: YceD family protein [Hydrogenovibrio sp.]